MILNPNFSISCICKKDIKQKQQKNECQCEMSKIRNKSIRTYRDSWVNGAMDNGSKLFISSKCCWLERNKLVSRIVNLHG